MLPQQLDAVDLALGLDLLLVLDEEREVPDQPDEEEQARDREDDVDVDRRELHLGVRDLDDLRVPLVGRPVDRVERVRVHHERAARGILADMEELERLGRRSRLMTIVIMGECA